MVFLPFTLHTQGETLIMNAPKSPKDLQTSMDIGDVNMSASISKVPLISNTHMNELASQQSLPVVELLGWALEHFSDQNAVLLTVQTRESEYPLQIALSPAAAHQVGHGLLKALNQYLEGDPLEKK